MQKKKPQPERSGLYCYLGEAVVCNNSHELFTSLRVRCCTAHNGPFGSFSIIANQHTGLNPVRERAHRVYIAICSATSLALLGNLVNAIYHRLQRDIISTAGHTLDTFDDNRIIRAFHVNDEMVAVDERLVQRTAAFQVNIQRRLKPCTISETSQDTSCF